MTEEVQVWVASLDVTGERYDALARALPNEEKSRAESLTPTAELRSLVDISPDERNAAFLRSWVVREARLKAEGKGVWSGTEKTQQGDRITHKLFAPRHRYIAAVAAPDTDWRLYTCAVKDE